MTKHGKRALLAAGILAGAAAMTGCTAQTTPAATSTPPTNQQETASPTQSAQASPSPEGGEESPVPLGLTADGQGVEADAVAEGDRLLLPLAETADSLAFSSPSRAFSI